MTDEWSATNELLSSYFWGKLLIPNCQINTFVLDSILRNWTISAEQTWIPWLGSFLRQNNKFCYLAQNSTGCRKLRSLIINTGIAPNMKLAVNSFPLNFFFSWHFPDFGRFPDIFLTVFTFADISRLSRFPETFQTFSHFTERDWHWCIAWVKCCNGIQTVHILRHTANNLQQLLLPSASRVPSSSLILLYQHLLFHCTTEIKTVDMSLLYPAMTHTPSSHSMQCN